MKLIVELHDHEGFQHQKAFWTFDDEMTVNHLMAKVKSVFLIEYDYQELFCDGVQIGHGTLKEAGVEDGKTIVVKHSYLGMFISCKKLLDENAKSLEDKRNIARKVCKMMETLDSTNFFDVYIKLYIDVNDTYAELLCCLKYDPSVILDSVKQYLGTENVEYVPEKSDDLIDCLIFDYSHEGMTETFYLKVNEKNWRVSPDARELVAYLLLQHIGVGPSKCYFIPIGAQSEIVVYNAIMKIPDFTMAKNLSNPMDDTAAVGLHLLAILLNLTNLDTENFGLNSSGSLCIVDFSLNSVYKDSSCVAKFKEQVRRQPVLVNLDNCPDWKRLQIAKEAMNRWNLVRAIDQVEQDFQKLKTEMKEEVEFLDRATGAIKEYLESIKWNMQKLSDEWSEKKSL